MSHFDVVVIGAGIVGLATVRALTRIDPGLRIIVVDKEPTVASHQTGHNSGVLHSGIYYRSDSEKAHLCTRGKEALEAWCLKSGVPFETCGKVIVATTSDEKLRLASLHERAAANGVKAHLIDRVRLSELEPHVQGLAALHIPATGVIDFVEVARRLADDLVAGGTTLTLQCAVTGINETADHISVMTTDGTISADRLINCGGLQSDRIARLAGLSAPVRIVPFRGEYHELVATRRHLINHLVYPVPDPRFPFLGVHFTKGLDGHVHIGPNALLALSREGYRRTSVSRDDVMAMARDPALWRLARRYIATGITEASRSLNRGSFMRALRQLVPDIRPEDVVRSGTGVRAQAVNDDGTLADDFIFTKSERSVHVLNAPSPAATASFAIGEQIARTLIQP